MNCDSKCRCKNCENQPGQNEYEEDSVPTEEVEEVKPQCARHTKDVLPEPVVSTRVSFDDSVYDSEPPQLPGGYMYGYGGSPSYDAGETASV